MYLFRPIFIINDILYFHIFFTVVQVEASKRTQMTKCDGLIGNNHCINSGFVRFTGLNTVQSMFFITDRSKAVLLLWFSVSCFGVSFGNVTPYVCTDCFSSVKVAELPAFGKELLTRFNIFSLCIMFFFVD